MATGDLRTFRNEDLILKVSPHADPQIWNESKYDAFLDELCGYREYQKSAIRVVLRFLLSKRYSSVSDLARESFANSDELQARHGKLDHLLRTMQLPDQLACSVDLATGTGKSYVLYGIGLILLAEGAVDRVLVLCPSNTIEAGLTEKFRELATNSDLRDALPATATLTTPRIINGSETIVEGAICVENYHAILEHVGSSIRDSLRGKGNRTIVLNDEAHHVANESGAVVGRWKEFLLDPQYGFRYVVGVSGTCYVGNDYFADVVYRYSLRQAIEERFVKSVEYVAEMPTTNDPDEKWQLIWNRHQEWKKRLKSRNIRPLTIVVTSDIKSCRFVREELVGWIKDWENITVEAAAAKVLAVSSNKEHKANLTTLRNVDSPASTVEWIISVSMLTEGWDVKNVFQIVPHEERAFNSKLLIAQVLGRGLRRPDGWSGEEPVVTVFNHDSWSSNIKKLVNEILEVERRLTTRVRLDSPYNFELHNLNYERLKDVSEFTKTGEYRLFEDGYILLRTQIENEAVTVEFERAISGEHTKFHTTIAHKTFSIEEIAGQLHRRFSDIDMELADSEDLAERTNYSKRFPMARCREVVAESLKRANITSGLVTDENRQKFLQALGPLRRKTAKRVVYRLSAEALVTLNTISRQADSCSASELRRGVKTIFYPEDCANTLADEQKEFFAEVEDIDGDFRSAREVVGNPANFKSPMNFAIADATPERKFIRSLVDAKNASTLDAWLKNTSMRFYSLEYAWRKGEHSKRGDFSPDFFIKQEHRIFVVEIKDDPEVSDPAPDNIKKYEYATAHFNQLNLWLERDGRATRYQFNMISPRDFNSFFQKMRETDLVGFRSELDVTMQNLSAKVVGIAGPSGLPVV